MQNSIDSGISPEVLKPLVIRALRRSSVRKKIAEYLFDISPSASYTSEIAHQVKTTPTNVIGAIRGMGTRYKQNESLINLNIIEPIEEQRSDIKLYRITDFGKEILLETRDRR